MEDGKRIVKENAPIYVYDTSGPYSDPNVKIDLKQGLPRMRESWILQRDDVEQLDGLTSEYGRMRQEDKSLNHLRFSHIQRPYRAKAGRQVSQMYYAKQGIITPEMEYVAIRENMNCEELGDRHLYHTRIRTRRNCSRTCRIAGQLSTTRKQNR